MTTHLIVKIKNVYGKPLVYPICNTSKKLAYLTNTATFTKPQQDIIKSLGYDFTVQPQTI
tara:strand:+ start:716 stop:895 length:180 start_codon:yes stop_codon:yes gene_type:complete